MFLKLKSPDSPKFWHLTSHFLPAAMPMRMYCPCYHLTDMTSAQEKLIPNFVIALDSAKDSTEELDPLNTPCARVRPNTYEKGKILKIKSPNVYRIAKSVSVSLWLTVEYFRGATVVFH